MLLRYCTIKSDIVTLLLIRELLLRAVDRQNLPLA
jgi:hypothetical protein